VQQAGRVDEDVEQRDVERVVAGVDVGLALEKEDELEVWMGMLSKFQMRLCSSKRSQNFSSARSSEMDSRRRGFGFGDMVTPGERRGGLRDVACPRTWLSWPDRAPAESPVVPV